MRERSGECDFIICKGDGVLQAVQVSYDISSPKTKQRELNRAIMAAKATGCKNLLLLTDHDYDEIDQDGFQIIGRPVYDWSIDVG
jgi:predicted AAA+ superfamily ATPase